MLLPCFSFFLPILTQVLQRSECLPSSHFKRTAPESAPHIGTAGDGGKVQSHHIDGPLVRQFIRFNKWRHPDKCFGMIINYMQGKETSLVDRLLKQEALMDQAKNTRTLVKRFIGFLRLAYPREMREFSDAVHSRKRRSWRSARVASFFKSRRTGCNRTTKPTTPTTVETTKPVCMCKTPCENTIVETEEPDKYKMFFSNPPLCRPTTTVDPNDMVPTMDMCGHSCDCHTETISSDNDKEIYIASACTTRSCGMQTGNQSETTNAYRLVKAH